MKWPRPTQVRTRLTLWYVLVLSALLIVCGIGASFVLVLQMRAQLKRQTVQDLETVEGLLYFDGAGAVHFDEDYHNHPESKEIQDRFLEVLSPSGEILFRNQRLGKLDLGGPVFRGEGIDGYSERMFTMTDGASVVLASRQHILQDRPILMRVGYSEAPIWARLRAFWLIFLIALPVTLAAAALAGYAMANRALNPIRDMVERAQEITIQRLHTRLPIEGGDELGNLARVFNEMLGRIEQSFEQLRRFTSDASHELRTPLASMRATGEVALQREVPPEHYRDVIGSMLEEINRLAALVDNLLMLSRADAGQVALKVDRFPAADIMKDAAVLLEPLMEDKKQKFILESDEGIVVNGDRTILRQAAINILHNAVKFTPVGGSIRARTSCDESCAVLSVTDSGPGIPDEHACRVFDRFYRVDPSRSDENKGAGLGLSIAQWAVRAHKGEIGMDRLQSGGCTFWIRLPLPNVTV